MSTTVTYKGATLATVDNATVTLETAGKYCEDDFTLTDVSGGGGNGPYVVGSENSRFYVNKALNEAGDTVTVYYSGSNYYPLPPMSQFVVADPDRNVLIVLKSGGAFQSGDTFTFTMPATSVVLMFAESM